MSGDVAWAVLYGAVCCWHAPYAVADGVLLVQRHMYMYGLWAAELGSRDKLGVCETGP